MKKTFMLTVTPKTDTYLFASQYGRVEFVVIEEDAAQLNDFCAHILEATHTKIQELGNRKRHGHGGTFEDIVGNALKLPDAYVRDGAFAELDVWQDTGDFMARANCLLLFACFTEKSLVHLCLECRGHVPKPRAGLSKVAAYLDFLRSSCGISSDDTPEPMQLRELCRKIRNAFPHEEWDACQSLVVQAELPSAFAAVTGLLQAIERATESKNKDRKTNE